MTVPMRNVYLINYEINMVYIYLYRAKNLILSAFWTICKPVGPAQSPSIYNGLQQHWPAHTPSIYCGIADAWLCSHALVNERC